MWQLIALGSPCLTCCLLTWALQRSCLPPNSCSQRTTNGLHQRLLLMAAWPHQGTDISLVGAAEFAPGEHGVARSQAQPCSNVQWSSQLGHLGRAPWWSLQRSHSSTTNELCEVSPFSAGQQLNFCKFGPFLLLFKWCFRHEVHSKRLHTSPPGPPPTTACSSTQLSKELLLRWQGYRQWEGNSSCPSYPLQQGHVQHWGPCQRDRNALYKGGYNTISTVCCCFSFSCCLLLN